MIEKPLRQEEQLREQIAQLNSEQKNAITP